MWKRGDWNIAHNKNHFFSQCAFKIAFQCCGISSMKLEFSVLKPSNDWPAWQPPIWWPHRLLEPLQQPQNKMGREMVTVPISRRGPDRTFCSLPVFSLYECSASKSPSTVQCDIKETTRCWGRSSLEDFLRNHMMQEYNCQPLFHDTLLLRWCSKEQLELESRCD